MIFRRIAAAALAAGLVLSGAAVGSAALTAPAGAAPARSVVHRFVDRDCGDFASQAAAQRFYLNAGGPRRDPHRLDADDDGKACDSNPCPCSSAQGGGGGGGGASRPPRIKQRAVVVRVVDGDTVRVRLRATRRVKDVRVIGINTPEVHGRTQCWGPQASRAAKRLLPRGTSVLLVSDRSQARQDRYGRLLRYVMKHGRTDVGRWQLARGNARVYVYNRKPFERVRGYRGVASSARSHDRGLWGRC